MLLTCHQRLRVDLQRGAAVGAVHDRLTTRQPFGLGMRVLAGPHLGDLLLWATGRRDTPDARGAPRLEQDRIIRLPSDSMTFGTIGHRDRTASSERDLLDLV